MDRYEKYPIRLRWKGRVVAGFRRMSDSQPGEAITLERGVTHDPGFDQWAKASQEPEELTLEREDEDELALHRCVVLNYETTPGGTETVQIDRLGLEPKILPA